MGCEDQEVPEGKRIGEIAAELHELRDALEKAEALSADLVERLGPILNCEALSKTPEENAVPKVCGLATEIRREGYAARRVVRTLAELLTTIEL